jgi:hypothetical protein
MLPFEPGSTRVAAVDNQLRERDTFLGEVKERLLQAQALMKQCHDKLCSELEFQVGNWVWLRLNQQLATTIIAGGHHKLGPKFFGSYEVLERIGFVAYRLQLPQHARIHDVFHITFLKKFEGTPLATRPPLPLIVLVVP